MNTRELLEYFQQLNKWNPEEAERWSREDEEAWANVRFQSMLQLRSEFLKKVEKKII